MKLISEKEIETIKTFSLSLKMKNKEKIVNYFKDKFEKDQDNEENAFNYGICMCLYLVYNKSDSDNAKHCFAVNEAFSKCLEMNDKWWLARYLRIEINQIMPDELINASMKIQSSAYKKINTYEEVMILLDQQKELKQKPSYFLCPYLLQTKDFILQGKVTEAINFYRTIPTDIPLKSCPYTIVYLYLPFQESIVHLRKLGYMIEAEEIKKTGLMIFPNLKPLLMA